MNLKPEHFYKIPVGGVDRVVLSLSGLTWLCENGHLEKVETLRRLSELAEEKRAVLCPRAYFMPPMRKNKPAAFVFRMSGEIIQKLIQCGLYVYEPIQFTGE